MGLYMNDSHGSIYRNDNIPLEPNQGVFVKNYREEMIKEQKRVYQSLLYSYSELKKIYEETAAAQDKKWMQLGENISHLNLLNKQHQKVESNMMKQLKILEANQIKMEDKISVKNAAHQEVLMELDQLGEVQKDILQQLKKDSNERQEIKTTIEEQTSSQKQLMGRITKHEQKQKEVVERLETQEALSEKIIRYLDHFRSILFERSNYLSNKIEDVSTYLLQSLHGKNELQKTLIIRRKQENKK
ncbi:hypothetical protein D8M04_14240 [Oceanobacillus piezotolerans]|uniref:Uncharacterized protein n=1 Tax=Oceanobacillus piezotolerans TaxID=2448030 RepID=A0A498D3C3_9BACI|nr:hypothetical protein [Oceanobacillus piezotolerans]RLL42711.1 hypothetical protein D8M04_14240 [Oceanobacillus piezotolerans]